MTYWTLRSYDLDLKNVIPGDTYRRKFKNTLLKHIYSLPAPLPPRDQPIAYNFVLDKNIMMNIINIIEAETFVDNLVAALGWVADVSVGAPTGTR